MQKGDLVHGDEYLNIGIILGIHNGEAEVFFGDSTRKIIPLEDLEIIETRADSPINFTELVDAYLKLRGFE